ncbi:MAG: hypothetical protein WA156_03490, partial [Methylocystis silviterrae]
MDRLAAAQHQPSAMIPFWRDRRRDFFRFRHVTDEKISVPVAFPSWQSAEAPPHSANIQWLDVNELQGAEGDQHVAQTVSSYDFGRGFDASDCRSGL